MGEEKHRHRHDECGEATRRDGPGKRRRAGKGETPSAPSEGPPIRKRAASKDNTAKRATTAEPSTRPRALSARPSPPYHPTPPSPHPAERAGAIRGPPPFISPTPDAETVPKGEDKGRPECGQAGVTVYAVYARPVAWAGGLSPAGLDRTHARGGADAGT
ncbi:hypothetical protein HYPSUDRAFT_209074 [Hypholoma sublateritium FD-334 SS-4]|uniref:Uncharacterized protein n=1 Tax=Hypholoma sublateritium (strain FD-334 SS-4) TaxID=945553 RepID=A0A0D2LT20_HYPSF|nr:hypothetical protein HYPSUDRAFT_209074 [Hypholoma sublateritium FD-334 SS-4]